MKLVSLQSLISTEVSGVLGCLFPPRTRCFQRPRGFSSIPAPVLLTKPGSSSRELYLLFRVRSCLSPVRHSKVPNAFSKVSFPFTTPTCGVHLPTGFQGPSTFRPQRFSRSRRVAPPPAFAGLFHPTAASGIRTPGGFPAAKSAHLIGESCPLVVTKLLLPASCLAGARSTRFPFRAFLQAAIRCSQQGV
jgi:hypothetical protein